MQLRRVDESGGLTRVVNVLVVADEVAPNLRESTMREIAPDLVLSAGDLPWDYLEWVAEVAGCPTVFVPGQPRPGRESPPTPAAYSRPTSAWSTAAGLRIAGLGGCVKYRPGPYQYTQKQFATRASRLLRLAKLGGAPVDVLLTHAPPLGLGDGEDNAHLGIEALHRVLERLEPTWHLHGHLHPYGQEMPDRFVGPTTIRNVIPWRVVDITPKLAANAV